MNFRNTKDLIVCPVEDSHVVHRDRLQVHLNCSNMNIKNSKDLIVCPFEDIHVVHVDRLQVHLVHCSRNHLYRENVPCPFDAVHVVRGDQLVSHIEQCPKRCFVERELIDEHDQPAQSNRRGNIQQPLLEDNHESREQWSEAHSSVYSYTHKWSAPMRYIQRKRLGPSLFTGSVNADEQNGKNEESSDEEKVAAAPKSRSINVGNFNPSTQKSADQKASVTAYIGMGRGKIRPRNK